MEQARRLGKQIRAARLERGLTQAVLAERLGISASYLNLLESGRRRLTAELVLRLARTCDLDLKALHEGEHAHLVADLAEVFADPIFEQRPLGDAQIAELAAEQPEAARVLIRLHTAHSSARGSAEALAERRAPGHRGAAGALPRPPPPPRPAGGPAEALAERALDSQEVAGVDRV